MIANCCYGHAKNWIYSHPSKEASPVNGTWCYPYRWMDLDGVPNNKYFLTCSPTVLKTCPQYNMQYMRAIVYMFAFVVVRHLYRHIFLFCYMSFICMFANKSMLSKVALYNLKWHSDLHTTNSQTVVCPLLQYCWPGQARILLALHIIHAHMYLHTTCILF